MARFQVPFPPKVQLLPMFYLLCHRRVEFNCEYAAISHYISEMQASGKVTI